MENEVINFYSKGLELEEEGKYGEALQWYVVAI